MTTINLRSRHLNNVGAGLNALTVEVYATDANGLPTGAAVASTATDANGVWKFLVATGLLHSTRYCFKVINGSEVQWLDGSDMAQLEELAVRTRLVLPSGQVLDSSNSAMVKIAEVEVVGAAVPKIELLTIPQTYRHLKLVMYSRCDNAAYTKPVSMRLNADDGLHYDAQVIQGCATGGGFAESFASTLFPFQTPGGSCLANLFGMVEISLPHYAGANNKDVLISYTYKIGASSTNLVVGMIGGFWRSNAAITSIILQPYAADNFVAGTIASLYGMP